MEVWIDNFSNSGYRFGLSGMDEIVQNVKVILSTRKGSVPLDRDFGVDWSVVDKPSTVAFQRLKQEIIRAIRRYEPRVVVKAVEIIPDKMIMDGIFKVRVKCEIDI